MTDEQLDALWLYRKNLHNGELMPQLRDFARALLSASKPAVAHDLLATLIEVYDDGQNNAPEDRCYVEGTWKEVLSEARAYLAASPAAPAQSGEPIYQVRVLRSALRPWIDTEKDFAEKLLAEGKHEMRVLYAAPQPASGGDCGNNA